MLSLHLRTLLLTSVMLLSVLSSASSGGSNAVSNFQHALVVSTKELQDLSKSPSISVVYFFVKDSRNIRAFLEQFEKSAKFLKVYNIALAVYNCSSDMADHEMCKKEKVEHHVYTFQNGAELLTLTLDTMFDVNSIMSNALQLALLLQVPIIQSQQELQELQRHALGKQDILIAYPVTCGTQEHRIFLEIAYAFQDRFKFALTTEFKVVQGLQNSELVKPNMGFAMWVLFCVESTSQKVSGDEVCHSVLYQEEISLTVMAQFVKRLSEKTLYYSPADGLKQVFDMTDNLPIIFIYTNKDVQGQTLPVLELAKFELKGIAKVVVVDMDNEDCKYLAEGQGFSGKLPVTAVKQDGTITFMEESKQWSVENVQAFIRSIIYQSDELSPQVDPETHYSTDLEPHTEFSDEVQRQDDQVAEAVSGLSTSEMELDHVPALLKHNFYKTVASADLMLILFYLPFDHISMAFQREFGHAAQILAQNFSELSVMARVNCYDGTDLCTAENITTYPVLRIYRRGQTSTDHKGSLDSGSVIKAVKLLRLNSPVQLTSEDEVEKFIKGEYPQSFYNFTPSSILLLTLREDTDEEQIFNTIAKSMSVFTAFGVVRGHLASTISKKYSTSVPSVMAFHRSDPNKPVRVLNEQLSQLSLTDFVKNSLLAAVPELTVMNLPTLFAKKQPFTILFLDPSDLASEVAMETFTKLALSGQFESVFCWMNAQAKTMGHKILSEYTWTATLPMITVVDHGQGELFNYQPGQLMLEDASEWLSRVLAKRIRPSKMLEYAKWVAPGPHYDFLAMIDEMERGEKQEVDATDDDYWFQAEQQNRDRQSGVVSPSDLDREEALRIDSETREELLELRKSRIYHQNHERRENAKKRHLSEQESTSSHQHAHVEL